MVNGVSAAGAVTAPTDRGMASMSTEDFFEVLITEMQQQDPFEPTKTADMISQVAQIRTIEQSTTLNDALDRLTQQQNVAGASDLLGKHVVAASVDDNGNQQLYEGIVTGVRFESNGLALLELDTGQSVRMADIRTVSANQQPVVDIAELLQAPPPQPAAAQTDDPQKSNTQKNWLQQILGL